MDTGNRRRKKSERFRLGAEPVNLCVTEGVLVADPFFLLGTKTHRWEDVKNYDPHIQDGNGQEIAFKLIEQFQNAGRLKLLAAASRHISRVNQLSEHHGEWVNDYFPNFEVDKLLNLPVDEVKAELTENILNYRAFDAQLTRLLHNRAYFDQLRGKNREWFIAADEVHYSAHDPESVTYTEFNHIMRGLKNAKPEEYTDKALEVEARFDRVNARLEAKIRFLEAREEAAALAGEKPAKGLFQSIALLLPSRALDYISQKFENKVEAAEVKRINETPVQMELPMDDIPLETEQDRSFTKKWLTEKLGRRQQQINTIFGLNEENGPKFRMGFSSPIERDWAIDSPAFLKKQLDVLDLLVECATDCNYSAVKKRYDETLELKKQTHGPKENLDITPFHKIFLGVFSESLRQCQPDDNHGVKRQKINRHIKLLVRTTEVEELNYQEKLEHQKLFGRDHKGRGE